jgi:hypothetical protein
VSSSSAAALAAASGSDPPTIDLGDAAAVSELADDSVSVAVEVGQKCTRLKPVFGSTEYEVLRLGYLTQCPCVILPRVTLMRAPAFSARN